MKSGQFIPTMILHDVEHLNQVPRPDNILTQPIKRHSRNADARDQRAPKTMPAKINRKPGIRKVIAHTHKPAVLPQIGDAPYPYVMITVILRMCANKEPINIDTIEKYLNQNLADLQLQPGRGKFDEWLDDVMDEFSDDDARENTIKDIAARQELLNRVMGIDYKTATQSEINLLNLANLKIMTMSDATFDKLKEIIMNVLAIKMPDTQNDKPTPASVKAPRAKKRPRIKSADIRRNGINAAISERFVKKYNGADNAAAMRMVDKKKRTNERVDAYMDAVRFYKGRKLKNKEALYFMARARQKM